MDLEVRNTNPSLLNLNPVSIKVDNSDILVLNEVLVASNPVMTADKEINILMNAIRKEVFMYVAQKTLKQPSKLKFKAHEAIVLKRVLMSTQGLEPYEKTLVLRIVNEIDQFYI